MVEEKENDSVQIRISKDLIKILDNIVKYMREISYDSLNPTYIEASKFLVARLKKRDLRNII